MVGTKVFCVLLAVATAFNGRAAALECYVCRGCAEVTPAEIQTCGAEATTDDPAGVTDADTFDVPSAAELFQVAKVPYLEEKDEEVPTFVLDNSELPGSKFLSRGLKQYRDGTSDARCVVAVFTDAQGATDVVRGCSTVSDDKELRCREAVGNDYTGAFSFCHLCEEELCNSAAVSTAAFVTVIVGVILNLTYF
ncbi:hypothetical protein JYU34_001791 [Plutella xylostella]|uniref:Protein sleepless n=1 Tax=Plutella xylostella TaxID=51655 RepID=A0ABQ7R4T6_PLUXY|nr:hypothetical protein JYU34_001791 [Plutella xylostella]